LRAFAVDLPVVLADKVAGDWYVEAVPEQIAMPLF
jgi:hypothetical protein